MTGQTVFRDIGPGSELQPLSDDEISNFFNDIDQDGDGRITLDDLSAKLRDVNEELAPSHKAKKHHLHRVSQRFQLAWADDEDVEKSLASCYRHYNGTHDFLRSVMPGIEDGIGKDEFANVVKTWNVPSQRQSSDDPSGQAADDPAKQWSWHRTCRAHWSVEGPRMVFLALVFCLVLAFFLWQGISYMYNTRVRAALGWGVVVAKFAAGALYPVLTIMLLSMSRWLSTWFRRSYWISRFVDWDYHKEFHIWMAWIGLFFATLHGLGHLTGSFLTGSRPSRHPALVNLVGPDRKLSTYSTFLRLLPGWSGIIALALYWIIALTALHQVRRRCYELFQLAHLLMFPFLALLCAHGAAMIIQKPMLGLWLLVPCALIVFERCFRLVRGFIGLKARMEILDDDTVALTIKHAKGQDWYCQAGQYILLQVPRLSVWQWHPFTVSSCAGSELHLHIKTDGNWTVRLRDLPTDEDIRVGLDGPFGAPTQRFYDFDRTIIIGAGVGVTPFSAIVTDLEQHLSERRDPWDTSRRPSLISLWSVRTASKRYSDLDSLSPIDIETGNHGPCRLSPAYVGQNRSRGSATIRRRVDFHWSVREERHLLWFSSLLNRAHDLAGLIPREDLELNINTYITAQRKNVSTHVFRYLLDAYRTPTSHVSALTGLRTRSQFGRADYKQILEDFYHSEIGKTSATRHDKADRVGVFLCGSPKVGRILSDSCAELNVRARADGSRMEFVFMTEVFG